ncbi:hypothetical protein KZ453_06860, partial [Glaesserella parasuis]|nr:hypothetical protein [Glaesserella parasuis]MCT8571138.1 hypothetical protein [Glaesserella parasuis]MCT8748275.1 hypothetical protein [Glaesserella parasuis]MCT8759386.1 hypothetical protein [Glaesserella parasuis]MCT8767775.1 hypothetical protein [Glaesserella parasuis]
KGKCFITSITFIALNIISYTMFANVATVAKMTFFGFIIQKSGHFVYYAIFPSRETLACL